MPSEYSDSCIVVNQKDTGIPVRIFGILRSSELKSGTVMSIGLRIKQARKLRGMTQVELARIARTQQAVISDLENGRQKSTTYIVDIANALRVRPEWIVRGALPMEPERGATEIDEHVLRLLDDWDVLSDEQRAMFRTLIDTVSRDGTT
jgi:transcriptional regulator with XRE-family HTH domain